MNHSHSPSALALNLLDNLIPKEVQRISNIKGTNGKSPLNPMILAAIKGNKYYRSIKYIIPKSLYVFHESIQMSNSRFQNYYTKHTLHAGVMLYKFFNLICHIIALRLIFVFLNVSFLLATELHVNLAIAKTQEIHISNSCSCSWSPLGFLHLLYFSLDNL